MARTNDHRKLPRDQPKVDPTLVRLERGKGSSGRGADKGGSYWHVYADGKRAGYVHINLIDEQPLGPHASIQIQLNVNARGRGIGRIAYYQAVTESEYDVVYAHMRKSNIGSKKAAEHAGFEVVHDPGVAQLLMKWERPK